MSVGVSRKRMEKWHETGKPREMKLKRLGPTFWLHYHRSCWVVVVVLVVVVVVHKSRHALEVKLL
jgi:hypothetical protein